MTAEPQPRVLLVSMPAVHPMNTSLALSLLSEILTREGLAADCLYGPLLWPRSALWETEAGGRFMLLYAGFLFGAYLEDAAPDFGDRFLDFMAQEYLAEAWLHGQTRGSAGSDPPHFPREKAAHMIATELASARVCLDRCEQRAGDGRYDIVGFSITFFTQLPASVALAQRLKKRNPDLKILFGGSGCLAEQADGLMRAFPVMDAVCYTEADDLIAPLVRALRGTGRLEDVPGLCYRRADGSVGRTSVPELRHDLDTLPLPSYDSYIEQCQESDWRDVQPVLFFETSRGCWWGQKHLCTFCGLSQRELTFRSKSPERVYAEISALYQRYPRYMHLHPTDDILDTRYFNTLLPMLARMQRLPGRPLRLFFEVKANMRPEQLLLLAQAGVGAVQPGIESFSDHILQIMDKGSTGLGQVQFIKWAAQAGVQLVYNMLIRNPGECAQDYREMSALVPYLMHLPPPTGVTTTELERFSPYFLRAESFGITNIRPKPYYELIFSTPGLDLSAIAYRFDYDHPFKHDPELLAAQREFVAQVQRWCQAYRPGQLYYYDRTDHLILIDARGPSRRSEILAGPAAELFRYLDRHRSFTAIRRRFAEIDEQVLLARLGVWQARGLVYGSPREEYLVLVPRLYEQPPTLDELCPKSPEGKPPAKDTARFRLPLVSGRGVQGTA